MDDSITPDNCNYVFTTIDCMGCKVALKEETFIYKICKDHPEVTPDLIKYGVESAFFVVKDPDHINRLRYYRYIQSPIQGRNDITNLKVVVEITSNEYNEIVTAYLCSSVKGQEINGGILYDASTKSTRGI